VRRTVRTAAANFLPWRILPLLSILRT